MYDFRDHTEKFCCLLEDHFLIYEKRLQMTAWTEDQIMVHLFKGDTCQKCVEAFRNAARLMRVKTVGRDAGRVYMLPPVRDPLPPWVKQ